MKERFTKYWDECNLLMAIGSVMDPRLKMRAVEIAFPKMFPLNLVRGNISKVKDIIYQLFDEYLRMYSLTCNVEESGECAFPMDTHRDVTSSGTMFSIVVQEAKLVRVLAVEQREVLEEAALSKQSQELWGIDSVERDLAVVSMVVLGTLASWLQSQAVRLGNYGVASPKLAIEECVGVAVAPVIGVAQGGVRKVNSVNSLVEALGSPAHQCTIIVARSRRGRGRPTKGGGVVESGGEVVNDSLTDSDIQARQRYLQSEAEATLKLGVEVGEYFS
ncbi:hypothetical protein V6N11_017410 [Hibiscus sabdariffa]|uniref:hAT-like transposase RNase-H fold domain-containing protein n=1 Tax=Hibiscus sabdariffa TaxID=183260 RepID=A0ABR2TXX5_9ROSI